MIKNIKKFELLIVLFFLSSCSTVEKREVLSQEEVTATFIERNPAPIMAQEAIYGLHTEDIQTLLEASPIGSEIYLKEGKNGEWHLRIEKIFTAESLNSETSQYFEDSLTEEDSFQGNFFTPEIITI